MSIEFRIFPNDTLPICAIYDVCDIPINRNSLYAISTAIDQIDKRLVAQFHISVAIILIFIFYHANLTRTLVFRCC